KVVGVPPLFRRQVEDGLAVRLGHDEARAREHLLRNLEKHARLVGQHHPLPGNEFKTAKGAIRRTHGASPCNLSMGLVLDDGGQNPASAAAPAAAPAGAAAAGSAQA